jgi:hypothetical protein
VGAVTQRMAAVAAGGVAAMAMGVVVVAGTGSASAAPAPAAKHNGPAAAVVKLLKAHPLAVKALVATPKAASAKPLSISPHTGLQNGSTVKVSAPAGTFKANDKPLVVVECNPDSSIPQDGSGCTGPQGVPGGATATGAVTAFSYVVKSGKIGSNANAYCPPTAAQKAKGIAHCIVSVSEFSASGTHAAGDITFASESTSSTGSGSHTSTGSSSSSSSSSSSGTTSGSHSSSGTSGTSAGLPTTGAPFTEEVALALGFLIVGAALLRFTPKAAEERPES